MTRAEAERQVIEAARHVDAGPTAQQQLRNALAALDALPADDGWRPIDTAPKNGEWVLTCIRGTTIPFVAAYDAEPAEEACWFSFNRAYETGSKKTYLPTHWMPMPKVLPAPPDDGGHNEE